MLNDIKTILFDLDGTIYYGDKPIPGAIDVINYLKHKNYKILFLTNTSYKKRETIFKKLNSMGVQCDIDQIYTSGYVTALYVKKNHISNPYIFGSEELKEEFIQMGIPIMNEENAHNLIIGFHPNSTFEELSISIRVALKSIQIIAANIDRTFPSHNGLIMPGAGAMVKAIEYSSNRTVDVIVGKPNPLIIDFIIQENKLNRSELVMIGDNYESDIVMSNNAKISSIYISNNQNIHSLTIDSISTLLTLL